MNTRELISALEKAPQDAPVVIGQMESSITDTFPYLGRVMMINNIGTGEKAVLLIED